MRVIGKKAVDLRRRDPDFLFREEELIQKKTRTGIFGAAVILAFTASVFRTVASSMRTPL